MASNSNKIDRQAEAGKRAIRRTMRNLHDAISKNNLREVMALCSGGNVDVNFHFKGQSALQIAVTKGYFDICAFLINKGADVNQRNAEMNSLLNMACSRGLECIAELLINNGALVDSENDQGMTPLNSCAYEGHSRLTDLLIIACCDPDKANNRGHTPIMTCARHGHLEIATAVINAGCDVDRCDEDLRSPLMVAAEKGCLDFVKMLIISGCDVNLQDKKKTTALFVAVSNGHLEIVRELIMTGANVNTLSQRNISPLLEAVTNEHKEIAKLLIKAGSDLNQAGYLKQTPLHEAVRQAIHYFGSGSNGTDMVKTLVNAGCDVNKADNEGWTAIYQSAFGGDSVITRILLDHKARINVLTNRGDSLLHGAIYGNKLDIVNMLIDAGCSVNVLNAKNELPIFVAVSFKVDIEILKVLVKADSRLDDVDNVTHSTPLMLAVQTQHIEAVKVLIAAGCDVNIMNEHKLSPLNEACERGFEEIVDLILKCPEVDVDAGDVRFPLITAVDKQFHGIVGKLINARCDLDKITSDGLNAIYMAAEVNNNRLVKLLLKWGCNPDGARFMPKPRLCCKEYTDPHPHLELSPLYAAVKHDNFQMISALVRAYHVVPFWEIDTLHDLLFKTAYAAEAGLTEQIRFQFAQMFRMLLGKPPSLQILCRGSVRKALGQRPQNKIGELEIPTKLKEFILISESF
ncbi:ankyrin repeat domain-containing protein 17-like [Lineus longissimus]|uniref:ankyrin repeat domain-containing protein 17-like n=1 Tax=Lineus longissimus TaxID=88925 RepID=UPI002B4D0564